ncbi:hypothetical protein ADIAL_0312 [Alkalibacterium sp. AK22]|uniref:hypothetical protein n=1 Tax=Alkalibacterium sp. AK22 TaxID=1229520 RepID=UPI00044B26B2|nr:hypothetical protein [Alkalibacterium sp. AK22]EXJ24181.1 hypothetical protein ADIAL_0312 [Alkalibacterium sp. AK22]
MKLVLAHQNLEELSAKVEEMVQNNEGYRKDLMIVCLKEHASEVRTLTGIKVDPLDESELSEENALDEYGLHTSSKSMYADILLRGGFLLLSRNE